jgi:hypothetical protein
MDNNIQLVQMLGLFSAQREREEAELFLDLKGQWASQNWITDNAIL